MNNNHQDLSRQSKCKNYRLLKLIDIIMAAGSTVRPGLAIEKKKKHKKQKIIKK